MISEIILHVGYPKTATTTVQEFLVEKEAILSGLKIFSLFPNGDPNPSGNSQKIAPYNDNDEFKIKKFINWNIAALTSYLQDSLDEKEDNKVIISAERFVIAGEESLQQFKLFLNSYCSKITIVIYLRRQDESALSFFQESCKPERKMTQLWGVKSKIFPDERNNDALEYFDYDLVLRKFEAAFGIDCVKPRVFDKNAFLTQSIILDFLNTCEIPISSSVKREAENFKHTNASLSRSQVIRLIAAHRCGVGEDKLKSAYAKIELIQSSEKFLPKRKDAKRFYRRYKKSNSRVAKRYNFSNSNLFSNDFSYCKNGRGLSITKQEIDEINRYLKNECEANLTFKPPSFYERTEGYISLLKCKVLIAIRYRVKLWKGWLAMVHQSLSQR